LPTFAGQITFMGLWNIFYSTATNKCPRCHAARVFENNNGYSFKNGLTMYKNCTSCGLKYEREVGYFYGSMYVSYAIQTALVSVLYFLNVFFFNLDPMYIILIIIGVAFAMFPLTFRWSRIFWIACFTKYHPELKGHVWKEEKK